MWQKVVSWALKSPLDVIYLASVFFGRHPRKKKRIFCTTVAKINIESLLNSTGILMYHEPVLWSDKTELELFSNKLPSGLNVKLGFNMREGISMSAVKHGEGLVILWACLSSKSAKNL